MSSYNAISEPSEYQAYQQGRVDKAQEIYEKMYDLLWEVDIPSPTCPEYVEHHQQIQNLMLSLKKICKEQKNE